MSDKTKTIAHHKKASEHHAHAARPHIEAASNEEAGRHEPAVRHARAATGEGLHALSHADKALSAHVEHIHV
jgi:hypothetical protein